MAPAGESGLLYVHNYYYYRHKRSRHILGDEQKHTQTIKQYPRCDKKKWVLYYRYVGATLLYLCQT